MKLFLKRCIQWTGLALATIVLAIGAFWLYLVVRSYQTYSLPKPTGSYRVGHETYDWTDENRTNAFVGKPQEKRELMADVWYPTSQTSGISAPYLPANWEKIADQQEGVGALFKHPLNRIKTNSLLDASVAMGTFPVIIFQPGYGDIAAMYTSYAENLASHGYVVIASSPTYISDLVVFHNGRAVKASPKASLPDTVSNISPSARQAVDPLLQVWSGDDSFLIHQAIAMNDDAHNPFYDRLDLERVGIMGHSAGGAVAYQVCKTELRCKIAIDMDGTIFGDITQPSRVPFLYLSSDHSKDKGTDAQEDAYNANILSHQVQPTYHVTIAGTAHFNYSDLSLYAYKPLMQLLGVVGPIDARKGIELSTAYIDDMCNKYLTNGSANYLDAPTQPAGVDVKTFNL